MGSRINDNGDVSFPATASAVLIGFWMARTSGEIETVALVGEVLPDLPGKISIFVPGFASNTNGLTVSKINSLESGEIIFVGPPKQGAGYSDLNDLGTSHLKILAHQQLQPPGFNDTWFFKEFGQPIINNEGRIAFWADARDALDPNFSSTKGIWISDNKSDLQLLVGEGIPVIIDGENKAISTITDISNSLIFSSTK
ncbi:MAG: choice-of-anchor tandem repeat NxxGxxAF-containing protein [Methylococcaceae bacterium]